MNPLRIRCSLIGKLMTEPTAAAAKAGEVLGQGAKSAIRELAAQDIFGIDFETTSKQMEKGTRCEPEAIALLNDVLGLNLSKNTERRTDDFLTGEADLFHAPQRAGFDMKCAWSAATFPILPEDIGGSQRTLYEWQCRGYLRLWDADRWTVAYALLDTPDDLIGYEPQSMHFVSHIPAHMRLTMWTIERDALLEARMVEKVRQARDYYAQVIADFDRTHRLSGAAPAPAPAPAIAKPAAKTQAEPALPNF